MTQDWAGTFRVMKASSISQSTRGKKMDFWDSLDLFDVWILISGQMNKQDPSNVDQYQNVQLKRKNNVDDLNKNRLKYNFYPDDKNSWPLQDPVRVEEAVALAAVRVVRAFVKLVGHHPQNHQRYWKHWKTKFYIVVKI